MWCEKYGSCQTPARSTLPHQVLHYQNVKHTFENLNLLFFYKHCRMSINSIFSCVAGMAALNGSLGSGSLSNGSGNTMEALSQAYSGIQQYAAAALPNLYSQSLLSQQSISAAGSQKEGQIYALFNTASSERHRSVAAAL